MSGGVSKVLALPLLVAALGALYSNPNPILDRFAGRQADARIHTDHLGHGALNNDKCWTFPGSSGHQRVLRRAQERLMLP